MKRPAVTEVVRAAGGIVVRSAGSGPEVLIVHRPKYDDWSFPKGKLEPGETDEQAAIREVEEETGMRCALDDEIRSVRYRDARGRDKIVRYWRMHVVEEGEFTPTPEIDECSWLGFEDAAHRLSHELDRALLRAVVS